MGQVATNNVSNLAFFSRDGPIVEPLEQNPSPKEVYNESITYLALVIGDGDNIGKLIAHVARFECMRRRCGTNASLLTFKRNGKFI